MDDKPKECDWGLLRTLTLWPRPRCDPPKYKVEVSLESLMFAGRTLYLCDHHFHNVHLRLDSIVRL